MKKGKSHAAARTAPGSSFHIATEKEIKAGRTTDVYFERTVKILKSRRLDRPVVAEVRAFRLPRDYTWAVLAGIEEAAGLLEGLPVSVLSMEEGIAFHAGEPVLSLSGMYSSFAVMETPLLGLLCQASGIATKAARCKLAAGGKPVMSFGARRMHPAVAPMIGRSAFIGGCDGVSVLKTAELIGEEPRGTMPHALILITGDSVKAFELFAQVMPRSVNRVALVDTLIDEKFEAIRAAESLGKELFAVRIDTHSSRRGDLKAILEEVRWELDLRGFNKVRMIASGGLDEDSIRELAGTADAFGVGTCISNAPVINFALDIVEVDGRPCAKRGKKSGAKQLLRCARCRKTLLIPAGGKPGRCCRAPRRRMLTALMKEGRLARKLPRPQQIRARAAREVAAEK